jgi:hypothetical protein
MNWNEGVLPLVFTGAIQTMVDEDKMPEDTERYNAGEDTPITTRVKYDKYDPAIKPKALGDAGAKKIWRAISKAVGSLTEFSEGAMSDAQGWVMWAAHVQRGYEGDFPSYDKDPTSKKFIEDLQALGSSDAWRAKHISHTRAFIDYEHDDAIVARNMAYTNCVGQVSGNLLLGGYWIAPYMERYANVPQFGPDPDASNAQAVGKTARATMKNPTGGPGETSTRAAL